MTLLCAREDLRNQMLEEESVSVGSLPIPHNNFLTCWYYFLVIRF